MPVTLPTPGDTAWFVRDRFGLFIHWGLYALAARHEWLQHREEISDAEYKRRYFSHFDPDLYDPKVWAAAASGAGMRYAVATTKHHEGFSLWDSKFTTYKATQTPAGRDLLHPMVDAFRQHDLRVGFYHSLIDWQHKFYTVDKWNGPQRNLDLQAINRGRDQMRYADFLHAQTRELLTEFGQVDLMWFDYSFPKDDGSGKGREDWRSQELLEMVRELQPDILVNNRLDLEQGWDFLTPEQCQPRQWPTVDGQPVVWEACQTLSGSWGYHRDEASWKSVSQLVRMLIDTVSKGGNLLLNVAPTGRGEFDQRALDRLAGIGEWMRLHNRSIYGCTAAPAEFAKPEDCRLTYNPLTHRLYVHVFAWPFNRLLIDGLGDRVEYAQLLNDASEISIVEPCPEEQAGNTLALAIPVQQPKVTVPVIELFLKP
jgi:alpha-L-fucosidase